MATLSDLETALNDYKRTEKAFSDLMTERQTVQAELNVIEGQLASAKASFSANEEALRGVAAQFAKGR